MTDIVELLERGVDTNAIPDVTDRVMKRGAAEIRRLRAEVKRYEDARINPDENDCCTAYQAEVEQLQAENKELRVKLEQAEIYISDAAEASER